MKSITIHGLDDHTARLLKDRADRDGLSLNRTIKAILRQALGVQPPPRAAHIKDFEEFLGVWTTADEQVFDRSTAELNRVDERDWS